MKLSEYISEVGDAKAAVLFGVKERTVASWRRHERLPRPRQADLIVAATNGVVTHAGIYSRPEPEEESSVA